MALGRNLGESVESDNPGIGDDPRFIEQSLGACIMADRFYVPVRIHDELHRRAFAA